VPELWHSVRRTREPAVRRVMDQRTGDFAAAETDVRSDRSEMRRRHEPMHSSQTLESSNCCETIKMKNN